MLADHRQVGRIVPQPFYGKRHHRPQQPGWRFMHCKGMRGKYQAAYRWPITSRNTKGSLPLFLRAWVFVHVGQDHPAISSKTISSPNTWHRLEPDTWPPCGCPVSHILGHLLCPNNLPQAHAPLGLLPGPCGRGMLGVYKKATPSPLRNHCEAAEFCGQDLATTAKNSPMEAAFLMPRVRGMRRTL